jgi:hypothetical protein
VEDSGQFRSQLATTHGGNPTTFKFTTRAFFIIKEHIFAFKTHYTTRGVVNFTALAL